MRLTVLKNHVPIHDVQVDTPDVHERYEIFVGRSEDCHVMIDDPLISRHHFVLLNEDGRWFCEKLSQLGLVTLNGQSQGRMPVNEGDEIKCGAYSVLVSQLPVNAPAYQAPVAPVAQPVYQAPEPVYQEPVAAAPTPEPTLSDMEELTPEPEGLEATEVMSEDLSEGEDGSQGLDSLDEEPSAGFGEETTEAFSDSSSDDNMATESYDGGEMAAYDGDSGDMGGGDDEKTSFFKAFVNYQLVLFGDHAPYDRYLIETNEVFIGRDPKKCQIVLDDPEVSTVHAVLRKTNIDVTLEDLNSSNGTILNGERINKAHLQTGDEFVIGSTSFSLETRSDLLEAESDRLMPVEAGQTIETEEIEEEIVEVDENGEVDFNSEAPPEKSILKRLKKDPAFRKKAIYVVAGLGVAYMFLGDSEPKKPAGPKNPEDAKSAEAKPKPTDKPKVQLSKEMEQVRNQAYELGVGHYDLGAFSKALPEFEKVAQIDATYKKNETYLLQTREAISRLEELDRQKRAEEERLKTKKQIEELLVKAREAVKEKSIQLAESLFSQIAEKDPENIEVQQLKMELESWQKEQEKIALEKAAKEASRKSMVDAMMPGKTFYLKKEWYRAILKLEEYLRRKGTDEDLVKEASEMLADAKNQLASDLGPLVGKARSLKEGQDLKSAYEAYLDILKIEPTHAEALNEVDDIRNQLDTRSKRIYREAIIAESLSLFGDAKEKFQEVQQISPSDSEYYRKASEKLRNYLE